MRGSVKRVQDERAIASLDCLLEPPPFRQNIAQRLIRFVAIRVSRNRLAEVPLCRREVIFEHRRSGEIEPRRHAIFTKSRRASGMFDGLIRLLRPPRAVR